jgi:hypothetical protein
MPRGLCKLCLSEKDLQRSHLIPKAVYKKSRSGNPRKPHPMVLTVKGSRQSSYQVMDYVFCHDCELLLSKRGEDYVMRLIHQNNKLPLLELLNSYGPGLDVGEFRFYSGDMTPGIDRQQIAYFAVSVFWRAAVHTWRQEDVKTVSIKLAPAERELLRQYLLGNTDFPEDAALLTYACSDGLSQRMFWMPGENERTKDRTFLLGVRGITFFFGIGESAPILVKRYCMINSPGRWITVRNCSHPRTIWTLG